MTESNIVGINQTSFKITYLKHSLLSVFFMTASISNTLFSPPPQKRKYTHTYFKAYLGSTSKATVSMNWTSEVGNCIYMKCAKFVSVLYTLHGYFQLSGLRNENRYEKDNTYNKQWLPFDFECSFWDGKCICLHQMTYHKTQLVFFWNQNNAFCSSVKMCAFLDTAKSFT